MSFLDKLFGDPNARVIKELQPLVSRVNELESEFEKLSEAELLARTAVFKERLVKGETLDDLLPEAFAVVRATAKRVISQRHFDVQILGGIILHRGNIAEMRTGEGKTLTATLPVYLNALEGKGVHVVTVNDYLARRDCIWMGKIYNALGLSVACINHERGYLFDPEVKHDDATYNNLRAVSRREAYQADITYGTNNEFGFDYLRDNMVWRASEMVQRPLHYTIVDEVDSILIDEARTPLIISAPAEEATEKYLDAARFVATLAENEDYNVDEKMRAATFTESAITKAEKHLGINNLYEGGLDILHLLEQALKARTLFKLDRDYVVREGEVVIVDEFTGRLMFGRRYSEGLHQAIEAKEGVKIQRESLTLATITFQNYFRLYKKLSGMTGTATTEAEEFAKIYNLEVIAVPPNRLMVRKDLSDSVFKTELGKFKAVVQEVKRRHELGQPVLVGTISIEKNEILSELLKQAGVPHEVLNAKHHEREAAIIAQAGRKGAVTIATNMAGRGVDIILGGSPVVVEEAEAVKQAGGLLILGTERHESRRIDNQLRGRGGRQGDPGASQFYVSLEDDLMRIFGGDRVKRLMDRLNVPDDMPIENGLVSKSIETAQKKVEGHNFDIRKHLVEYDDVLNKQRESIYNKRREILKSAEGDTTHLSLLVEKYVADEIVEVVAFHTALEDESQWNLPEIYEVINSIFPLESSARKALAEICGDDKSLSLPAKRDAFINYLVSLAKEEYKKLEAKVVDHATKQSLPEPEKVMREAEKTILLRSIDTLWVQHLTAMDHLRGGIGLQGYGQRDPLVEYKREGYKMYKQLLGSIQDQVVYNVFKVSVVENIASEKSAPRFTMQESGPAKTMAEAGSVFAKVLTSSSAGVESKVRDESGEKVGRNDLCPCGSGKKYKKCHGA